MFACFIQILEAFRRLHDFDTFSLRFAANFCFDGDMTIKATCTAINANLHLRSESSLAQELSDTDVITSSDEKNCEMTYHLILLSQGVISFDRAMTVEALPRYIQVMHGGTVFVSKQSFDRNNYSITVC